MSTFTSGFNPFASVSTNQIVNPVAIKEALTQSNNSNQLNSNSQSNQDNNMQEVNQVSSVNTVETPTVHPTTTTEVVTPNVTNTVAETVEVTETTKRVSSKDKYAHLLTFHKTWGDAKIVSLDHGKVKKDNVQALSFLNWLNTVVVGDNCLEKLEVLFVIKQKLSEDLGIESTVNAAEGLWNAMNMNKWNSRTNVKSGYTRNKIVYEW